MARRLARLEAVGQHGDGLPACVASILRGWREREREEEEAAFKSFEKMDVIGHVLRAIEHKDHEQRRSICGISTTSAGVSFQHGSSMRCVRSQRFRMFL